MASPSIPPTKSVFADEVRNVWQRQCEALRERDRDEFQKHYCSSIQEYLQKLEAACSSYNDSVRLSKIIDWFEPLYKAIELVTPALAVGIQAYPNPGSLVLGGVVGLLSLTDRLIEYQKLTLGMLSRMGRKSKILLQYESQKGLFKDDAAVQSTLLLVYGDILAFCNKAFRFLVKKNGKLQARVKGFRLLAFRDYESYFEDELQSFEDHVEDLEAYANRCFRQYVETMSEREEMHHGQNVLLLEQTKEHLRRQTNLLSAIEAQRTEHGLLRTQLKDSLKWLEWLSSSDELTSHFDKKCEEHLPGTGVWLLDSDAYQTWKARGRSDLLWVTGKPGCGKSILAAVAVMDLKVHLDTPVAYAFCRGEDESSKESSAIMSALAGQLGRHVTDLTPVLKKHSRNAQKPSHFMLQNIMKTLLDIVGEAFLVIDGLDECMTSRDGGDDDFSRDLLSLLRSRNMSTLKVLVLSRPEHQLQKRFNAFPQIQVDLGANEADLRAYIDDRFPDEEGDGGTSRELRAICMEKAEGMFLWVKLVWQYLDKENLHGGQKLARVSKMPVGLATLYNGILEKIWSQDAEVRSTAFLVLAWIVDGHRPLHGNEMIMAVADWQPGKKISDTWRYPKPGRLVTLCMGLVYVDDGGFFRLCHESAREFLEDADRGSSQPLDAYLDLSVDIHDRFATICLNYLCVVGECAILNPRKTRSHVDNNSFAFYAALEWGHHAAFGDTFELWPTVNAYIDSPWNRKTWGDLISKSYGWLAGRFNPLHILCFFGLSEFAESLPNVAELSQEYIDGGFLPLTVAVEFGHLVMSEWLIKNTPSREALARSSYMFQTVSSAMEWGWDPIVAELLDMRDPNVNCRSTGLGRKLLLEACVFNRMETVRLLLDYGSDVNCYDNIGYTPLCWAVLRGSESIVQLLLDAGADIHARKDEYRANALQLAADQDGVAVLDLLLSHATGVLATDSRIQSSWESLLARAAAADRPENIKAIFQVQRELEFKSTSGSTALGVAVNHGSFKAVQVLLDLGADKDAMDNDGCSIVWKAALRGRLDILRTLIEAGCDISGASPAGGSILQAAVSSGKLEVVGYILDNVSVEQRKRLLDSPDTRKPHGYPIHTAVELGHNDIFHLLLSLGADISTRNFWEQSILHIIALKGRSDLLYSTLSRSRDANPRDSHMVTPLHLAAEYGHLDFIRQFVKVCTQLELPLDFGARSSNGTPLIVALRKGHEKISLLLLEHQKGIPLDYHPFHPIHLAAYQGFDSTVQQLMDEHTVVAKDTYGMTAIMLAAGWGQISTVRLLAEKSASIINETDQDGWTALMWAVEGGYLGVADLLLDHGAHYPPVPHSKSQGRTLLHLAVKLENARFTERLISLRCDIDALDDNGQTALHRALKFGRLEIAKLLIEAGTNLNYTDSTGWTYVAFAAFWGRLEIVKELASHGVELGCANILGETPLLIAARKGHDTIVRFLHEAGEHASAVDLRGVTPLMSVSSRGYYMIARFLITVCPEQVDRHDKLGGTAIHLAARDQNHVTLKDLLQAGVDPCALTGPTAMSANDYAYNDIASLREIHRAGYFHTPTDMDSRRITCYRNIVLHCKELLSSAPPVWALDTYGERYGRIRLLSSLLRLVGDIDRTRFCLMEVCQPLTESNRKYRPWIIKCRLCSRRQREEFKEMWVCKLCPETISLCEMCYENYTKAGCQIPEPTSQLSRLLLQPVAAILETLAPCGDLLERFRVMTYIDDQYPEFLVRRFEAWKEEHNPGGSYDGIIKDQKGLEFIAIMDEASKLIPGKRSRKILIPDDPVAWAKLEQKFQTLQAPCKLIRKDFSFPCNNHPYLCVAQTQSTRKTTSDPWFDSEAGLLNPEFFRHLISKYDDAHLDTDVIPPINIRVGQSWPRAGRASSCNDNAEHQVRDSQNTFRSRRASIAVTCPGNAIALPIGPTYEIDGNDMLINGPKLPARRPRSLSQPAAHLANSWAEFDVKSRSDPLNEGIATSSRVLPSVQALATRIREQIESVQPRKETLGTVRDRRQLLQRSYRQRFGEDMIEFHLYERSAESLNAYSPKLLEDALDKMRDAVEQWEEEEEDRRGITQSRKPGGSAQHWNPESDSDSESE